MYTPEKNAVISKCGRYRYVLRRQISELPAVCIFIMLNPSIADAEQDDPTIRRCIGFAKRLGCGELIVLNLFAFRATKPKDLFKATDPVGPDNHTWITETVDSTKDLDPQINGIVICAWGAHGSYIGQDQTVLGWLELDGVTPYCLGKTKHGHPRHPLYLPADAKLQKML